jgi:DNA-binding MarR family transcriptional regulator
MRTSLLPQRRSISGCAAQASSRYLLQELLLDVEHREKAVVVVVRRLHAEHRAGRGRTNCRSARAGRSRHAPVGHAHLLQDLHRAAREDDGAAAGRHLQLGIQHHAGHAVARQFQRRHQPGRAGAGDHHRVPGLRRVGRRQPGGRMHLVAVVDPTGAAWCSAGACETALPLGEGRCLAAIGAFAPLSVKDLAHRANVDKGQASRAAQSLVDKGLVVKTPSAADARGVELAFTPAGEQLWRRLMRVIERRNAEIVACLSPAEQAQLDGLLGRLVAHARTLAERRDDALA